MKEVDYQIKINALINMLPPEKLREKLLSIAYNTPPERRDDFIKYFYDEDVSEGIANEDSTVINDGFDSSLLFLDELNEEEIYLTRVYHRTSDLVDESTIKDEFKIEVSLHTIFKLLDRLLLEKEFSKALAIYSKLKDLYIPVQDDEYEMLSYSLEEYYSDSNKYVEDIAHVGTGALLCIYSMPGSIDIKIKKFCDYLNSPLCRSVTAQSFIKENSSDIKMLEEFLSRLLPELFETSGPKSIEWIQTIAPIDMLSANIEKYSVSHPRLFRILMLKCIYVKQYKQAFEVGRKALEMMDPMLIERGKTANLILSISLYLRGLIDEDSIESYYYTTSNFSLEKDEVLYLYSRFESRSTMNNFLSLYRNISENLLLKKRLFQFLSDSKSILVNEDEDNELLTNIINRDVSSLAFFLLNPCLQTLKTLKIKYSSYDREYRNTMINMFLLFLSQESNQVEYMVSIVPFQNEIGYDPNLYVKFNLNLSTELLTQVLDWISDSVFRLTEAMIENGDEKYYARTSYIIKALNKLLLKYNIDYLDSSAIEYYNTKYSSNIEFLKYLNTVE